jgi:hypothetical protein
MRSLPLSDPAVVGWRSWWLGFGILGLIVGVVFYLTFFLPLCQDSPVVESERQGISLLQPRKRKSPERDRKGLVFRSNYPVSYYLPLDDGRLNDTESIQARCWCCCCGSWSLGFYCWRLLWTHVWQWQQHTYLKKAGYEKWWFCWWG